MSKQLQTSALDKLSPSFRQTLTKRGWNERAYIDALASGDEDDICDTHPSKWMRPEEVEKYW